MSLCSFIWTNPQKRFRFTSKRREFNSLSSNITLFLNFLKLKVLFAVFLFGSSNFGCFSALTLEHNIQNCSKYLQVVENFFLFNSTSNFFKISRNKWLFLLFYAFFSHITLYTTFNYRQSNTHHMFEQLRTFSTFSRFVIIHFMFYHVNRADFTDFQCIP